MKKFHHHQSTTIVDLFELQLYNLNFPEWPKLLWRSIFPLPQPTAPTPSSTSSSALPYVDPELQNLPFSPFYQDMDRCDEELQRNDCPPDDTSNYAHDRHSDDGDDPQNAPTPIQTTLYTRVADFHQRRSTTDSSISPAIQALIPPSSYHVQAPGTITSTLFVHCLSFAQLTKAQLSGVFYYLAPKSLCTHASKESGYTLHTSLLSIEQ